MSNDKRIKQLMMEIEKQEKNLGKRPRASFITTGLFKVADVDSYNRLNINVVRDIRIFVQAFANMRQTVKQLEEAAEELSVTIDGYKAWGYTIDEWKEDFLTRISILQYDDKKRTLDEFKSKLKSLVSEEAKTEMDLDDIEKLLSSK